MSAGEWSGSLLAWEQELTGLKDRISGVFGRSELRETAAAFLDGLLSGVERKTGWLLSEQAGLERPWRMQALLGRSRWSADDLRDRVQGYVIEALGDVGGVLVVDETGFVKKGRHSVGVARQYSGTAGRIENCQIGVFLGYASRYGQALIDRRLYLPKEWAEDAARRAKAQVPTDTAFATKPELAREMIATALDASAPCAWVLGDAVYGSDSRLRRMLEERRQPYALAVRSNLCLRFLTREGLLQTDPPLLHHAGGRDLKMGRAECASYHTTESTRMLREEDGWVGDPNNGGHCIANLQRLAQDGEILDFYQHHAGNRNVTDARKLVNDISDLSRRYPTENYGVGMKDGSVIVVSPGLAFDAGFTRAYLEGDGSQNVEALKDEDSLRIASKCTGQQMRRDVCEAVGYRVGQQVYRNGTSSVISMR